MAGKDSNPPPSPAARKAKPRDLAEEHKPSRKVALNEVLRSLQDLINNELAVVPPKTPAATENVATEPAATESPPPAAPAIETTMLAPEPSAPPEPPVITIPPEGLQQELPFASPSAASPATHEPVASIEPAPPPILEAPPVPGPQPVAAAPSSAEPLAPAESAASSPRVEIETTPTELPPLEPLTDEPLAPLPTPGTAAEQGDLSEIPVLEDVIDFHDETEPRAGGVAPPASEARRLAIQVAARLNIELRKAGKPSLASDVITRLARILEEALAKAGANMENNPPEKH